MTTSFGEYEFNETIVKNQQARALRVCRDCLETMNVKAVACPHCGCAVAGPAPTLVELEQIKQRGPVNLRECPECLSDVSVHAKQCPTCGCATKPPTPPPLPRPSKAVASQTSQPHSKALAARASKHDAAPLVIVATTFALIAMIGLMSWWKAAPGDWLSLKPAAEIESSYVHANGGPKHTVVERGPHVFSDGARREGVKVRDSEGYEYWIEKTAFDRTYQRQ